MTGTLGSVLITGATGFLGAHVARAFAKAGWRVSAGRRATSDPWRLAGLKPLAFVDCDLADNQTVVAALASARPQVLVHCAAYGVDYAERDFERALAVNVTGVARLIEAAAAVGVARIIHIGTGYEFGATSSPVPENAPLEPQSVYGATKAAGAVLAAYLGLARHLPLAILRPFTMYGPDERASKLVPSMIHACLSGKPMKLTPGGQIRDFLHVDDVADAIARVAALDAFPAGMTFNIGSGQPMTLRVLGETIARTLGAPDVFAWGEKPYRSDEVMELWTESAKLERLIGKIARTPLAEGIRAAAAAQDFEASKAS